MEGSRSTMVRLNNSNWITWKPRMEDILYCKDLHEPIEGVEAKTEGTLDANWKKMNRKAIGHIREWVDDSVFHHVANETDAHELWKKLESLFEKKTAAKKAFLIKEFVNMKYSDDVRVTKHLNNFQSTINQLTTMGMAINDELQALLSLRGGEQGMAIDDEDSSQVFVAENRGRSKSRGPKGHGRSMWRMMKQKLQRTDGLKQPEGFKVEGKEHMVCKLKKSLYGLKQAPRQWYKKFDSFIVSHGYKRTDADPYVSMICKLKADLSKSFNMKDLRPAKQILGMEITLDRKTKKLWLSHERYVERVLERFNMKGAKVVSSPLSNHFKLVYHPRTKHIDLRYHWIRDVVSKKLLQLRKIHTNENISDMLTKVMPQHKLEYCSKSAGMDFK
ncbi:hypothetical protein ACLB2K_050767 [Fragaria x ananassa]